ncbi:MAG: hypothetical protein J6X39_02585 [Bacteroidales bacterium]|nr:hypothetical protein [Bacteroidales bacterium]
MKLKLLLLAFILPFVFHIDMYADDEMSSGDVIINGINYYIDITRIVDDKNHRLTKEEIQDLAIHGFDYETWNKLNTKYIICRVGFMSSALMAASIGFYLDSKSKPWELVVGATILLTSVTSAILEYRVSKQFKQFMGSMDKKITLGVTSGGVGLVYSF